jgi:hypothetical protein
MDLNMNMNLKKENKRMIYSPEKLKMIVLNYLVVSEVLDNKHYVKCKMLVFDASTVSFSLEILCYLIIDLYPKSIVEGSALSLQSYKPCPAGTDSQAKSQALKHFSA